MAFWKPLARLLDLVLFPLGLAGLLCTYVVLCLRYAGTRKSPPGRNLLLLSPSGYAAVRARGTEHLGALAHPYFPKILFLCPGSPEHHEVSVSPRFSMMDVPHPAWVRRVKQMGCQYTSFLLGQACSLGWMCRLIRQRGFGVIRSMEPHIMGLRGVLLKGILGVKHIQDVRGNFGLIFLSTGRAVWPPQELPRWAHALSRYVETRQERFVYRRSDYVFGGNKNNLDYAIHCGAPLRRSVVARVNIQPDLFEDPADRRDVRDELGLPGKLLLYCGRLSPEKFPADVLRAFGRLACRREDAGLLIAGDGPQRAELERYIAEHGLGDRVRMLGYRENRFLKDLFASIDVMICPLAGSVLVEAALAERPLVAYHIEWHCELVVDGYSGLLANYGDIDALADACEYLLDHPDEARRFGQRARQIAISLFQPEVLQSKEGRLYASLFTD
jgi:glycosyltransferase involved in cell wall biosynthesis